MYKFSNSLTWNKKCMSPDLWNVPKFAGGVEKRSIFRFFISWNNPLT